MNPQRGQVMCTESYAIPKTKKVLIGLKAFEDVQLNNHERLQ